MTATTEAFARLEIDGLLRDAGWNLADGVSVLFEHALLDGTQTDYALATGRNVQWRRSKPSVPGSTRSQPRTRAATMPNKPPATYASGFCASRAGGALTGGVGAARIAET